MTRTAETTWTMSCDGVNAAACDVVHPDYPHTCSRTLTAPDPLTLQRASADAGWLTSMVDTREVHHCPTHRHQAWPEGCRCTLDPDGTRTTHACTHHDQAPAPAASSCWRGECRTSCAYPETCTTSARTTPGT